MTREEAKLLKYGDKVIDHREGEPDKIMKVSGLYKFENGSDFIELAYIEPDFGWRNSKYQNLDFIKQ